MTRKKKIKNEVKFIKWKIFVQIRRQTVKLEDCTSWFECFLFWWLIIDQVFVKCGCSNYPWQDSLIQQTGFIQFVSGFITIIHNPVRSLYFLFLHKFSYKTFLQFIHSFCFFYNFLNLQINIISFYIFHVSFLML